MEEVAYYGCSHLRRQILGSQIRAEFRFRELHKLYMVDTVGGGWIDRVIFSSNKRINGKVLFEEEYVEAVGIDKCSPGKEKLH